MINAFSIGPDNTLNPVSGEEGLVPAVNVTTLTIDPTGRFLYAADAGSTSPYAYAIGPTGGLTAIAGSPFTAEEQCNLHTSTRRDPCFS